MLEDRKRLRDEAQYKSMKKRLLESLKERLEKKGFYKGYGEERTERGKQRRQSIFM